MSIEKTVELCRNNARNDTVDSILGAAKFNSPKEVVAKMITEINTVKQRNLAKNTYKNSNQKNGNNGNKNNNFHKNNYKNSNNGQNFNDNRNGNGHRQNGNGKKHYNSQNGNGHNQGNSRTYFNSQTRK